MGEGPTMHTERGFSGRTTLLAVFELTGGAIPVIAGVRLGVHINVVGSCDCVMAWIIKHVGRNAVCSRAKDIH